MSHEIVSIARSTGRFEFVDEIFRDAIRNAYDDVSIPGEMPTEQWMSFGVLRFRNLPSLPPLQFILTKLPEIDFRLGPGLPPRLGLCVLILIDPGKGEPLADV